MTIENGNPANHLFVYAVEEYDTGNGKKAKTFTGLDTASADINLGDIPLT